MTFSATRALRRGAVVASLLSATCGALGASTASAVPVSVTLNYTCNFPLLLPQPLKLTITSDIPATQAIGTATNAFQLNASADVNAQAAFGLKSVAAVSVEGTAEAQSTVLLPQGTSLPVYVDTVIATTPIPDSGGFTTAATGSTPPLYFSKAGTAKITVGDLVLTLTPRLVDGTKTGLDTFETECKQVAGQNNTLASIQIVSSDTTAPTTPGTVIATPSDNSVALTWGASTDNTAVTGYDVYQNGVKVQTVTGTSASITGLTPGTAYTFKVQAFDAAGNKSAFSAETSTTTTNPGGGTKSYSFGVAGSATIKTLTKGSVPLTGSFNAVQTVATGAFTGDLTLNPATAKLTALGFLPVTAQVAFVSTAQTTGTVTGTALTAESKVRIKLPSISVLGVQLAGGANCQASQISTISLKSTGTFSLASGGTIAGSFPISNLTGCGVLNGLVSPLTSGNGNAVAVTLTPKATA